MFGRPVRCLIATKIPPARVPRRIDVTSNQVRHQHQHGHVVAQVTADEETSLMTQRSGTANLPLHGGQVPKWLADRMTLLGAVISEAIVHYGRDELLRRLGHPFRFESFGAVMGMDWHS